MRCRVGRGVAVLCGTHPELRPARAWLLPEDGGGGGGAGEGEDDEEEEKEKEKEKEEEEESSTGTAAAAAAAAAAAEALAAEGKTVSELVSALDDPAASAERGRYWESLLDAAGLGGLRGG